MKKLKTRKLNERSRLNLYKADGEFVIGISYIKSTADECLIKAKTFCKMQKVLEEWVTALEKKHQ